MADYSSEISELETRLEADRAALTEQASLIHVAATTWLKDVSERAVKNTIAKAPPEFAALTDGQVLALKRDVDADVAATGSRVDSVLFQENAENWPHLTSRKDWWHAANLPQGPYSAFPQHKFSDPPAFVARSFSEIANSPVSIIRNNGVPVVAPAIESHRYPEPVSSALVEYRGLHEAALRTASEIEALQLKEQSDSATERWESA